MYITTRASCQKKLTADSRRGQRPQSNGRYIEDREYRVKYGEQERERREELARLGLFLDAPDQRRAGYQYCHAAAGLYRASQMNAHK